MTQFKVWASAGAPDAESLAAVTDAPAEVKRFNFKDYAFNPNCFYEVHKFRHRVEFEPEYCKDHLDSGNTVLWAEQPRVVVTDSFKRSLEDMTPQHFVKTACLTRAINRCMNYPCLTEPR